MSVFPPRREDLIQNSLVPTKFQIYDSERILGEDRF